MNMYDSEHGCCISSALYRLTCSGPKPEIRRTRPSSWYTRSLYSVHTGVQASQELFMLDTNSGEVWSASPWSRRDSGRPSRPPAVSW